MAIFSLIKSASASVLVCLLLVIFTLDRVGGQLHAHNPQLFGGKSLSLALADPIHTDAAKLVEVLVESRHSVSVYPPGPVITDLAVARQHIGDPDVPGDVQTLVQWIQNPMWVAPLPGAAVLPGAPQRFIENPNHAPQFLFTYSLDAAAGNRVRRAHGEVAHIGQQTNPGVRPGEICDVMMYPDPGMNYNDVDFKRNGERWTKGHIIAASLGGHNQHSLNFFPHDRTSNNVGRYWRMETIARAVKTRCGALTPVIIDIEFDYPGYGGPAPTPYHAQRFRATGGTYTIRILRADGVGTCRQILTNHCSPNPASADHECAFYRQSVVTGLAILAGGDRPVGVPTPLYTGSGVQYFQMTRDWTNNPNDRSDAATYPTLY